MERDFLGVVGKESGALSKDDGRSNTQDSVFYGNGSGTQWPASSKAGSLPHFMAMKAIREGKSDQFSISGFQPKPDNFNPNPRIPTPALPQQYAVHGYGPSVQNVNGSRVFPVVSHHTGPFTQNNPFMKLNNNSPNSRSQNVTVAPVKQQQPNYGGGANLNSHLVGSTLGVFVPREMPKPSPTAQMTIFYAGSVCSFDSIPMDKAKEILMLASKAVTVTPPPSIEPPLKIEPSVKKLVAEGDTLKNSNSNLMQQSHKQSSVAVACPVTSSPVSVVSHAATLSRSASSSINSDSNVTKCLSPLGGPTSQPEPPSPTLPPPKLSPTASASPPAGKGVAENPTASVSAGLSTTTAAAIMPRAVPQARKASLARFLEKRKERVSSVAPYSKQSENGDVSQNSNNNLSSKPCTRIDLSRNCDDSFSLGQSNNSNYTVDAPSTELQM